MNERKRPGPALNSSTAWEPSEQKRAWLCQQLHRPETVVGQKLDPKSPVCIAFPRDCRKGSFYQLSTPSLLQYQGMQRQHCFVQGCILLQLHDFWLAFEANLGVVPSCGILPHVMGETQCIQTDGRDVWEHASRCAPGVHLMHLSHSQVYSPWEQTKCHPKQPPPPSGTAYGEALAGNILSHLCWSMLREPDTAWASWRGTRAVSAIPGTGEPE